MKKNFYYILLLVSLALKGQDLKSKADENYQSQDLGHGGRVGEMIVAI